MKYTNPAVVLGGGVTGLGVIRNLGRSGVDVYCVVGKKDEAVYSKYCKEYFVVPEIGHCRKTLQHLLTKIEGQFSDVAVLFPTSDMYLLNLSDLKNELGGYHLTIPNKQVLEVLVKKVRFYESLARERVPHPMTYFSDLEEVIRIGKKIAYPVFVKPSVSQVFFKHFGKKGFVAHSKTELLAYLKLVKKCGIGDVTIQEIIPGPPTNHYFIDGYFGKDSEPLAIFARRRLRMWPMSFGNSTACVSIPISDVISMKETIVAYLRYIGYHGIFSAEFKKDERDNIGKLLEVNARSWWYNSFPSKCGINIILTAYLDAIGEHVKYMEQYEVDNKLIYFFNDLRCSLSMLIKKDFDLQDWIRSYLGKREWTFFAKDDLRPCIMSIKHTFCDGFVKSRKTRIQV